MSKLIYSTICSLDGFIEDADGDFQWGAPDEDVHAFINDLERPIGTYLYGRRMYETMRYWEDVHASEQPGAAAEFAAIWRAADKVVFSRSLREASSARTSIETRFEPEAIRGLKASATADMSVGGPELAGQFLESGLVDELQLFVMPVVLGSGKRALPATVRLDLRVLDVRRFDSGAVYLRYSIGPG